MTLSSLWRFLGSALRWLWKSFRRLPLVLQLCIAAAAIGATLMGVFVGNLGLALMGTAIGISGLAVGATIGALVVIVPWATKIIVTAKRNKR